MKRTMSIALCVAIIMFSVVACKKKKSDVTTTITPTNQFTDTRDNQTYATVTIGTQTWMAQNLNYTTANSKKPCTTGADSCKNRGLLYPFADALTACPSGYHLPSNSEWDALEMALGATDTATYGSTVVGTVIGTKLRVGGSSGFNALMTGNWTNTYGQAGIATYFSTSTGSIPLDAMYMRRLTASDPGIYRVSNTSTSFAFCVRCLKN
jgi:uncharacterized protein (TIGR02145 family)